MFAQQKTVDNQLRELSHQFIIPLYSKSKFSRSALSISLSSIFVCVALFRFANRSSLSLLSFGKRKDVDLVSPLDICDLPLVFRSIGLLFFCSYYNILCVPQLKKIPRTKARRYSHKKGCQLFYLFATSVTLKFLKSSGKSISGI